MSTDNIIPITHVIPTVKGSLLESDNGLPAPMQDCKDNVTATTPPTLLLIANGETSCWRRATDVCNTGFAKCLSQTAFDSRLTFELRPYFRHTKAGLKWIQSQMSFTTTLLQNPVSFFIEFDGLCTCCVRTIPSTQSISLTAVGLPGVHSFVNGCYLVMLVLVKMPSE